MEELRKTVLILGNGFDLDLGLKTSYKDFWESRFCPKDYPAPLIHHLNQRWQDDLEAVKWYDLENELINYYKSIPDPTKGKDIITKEERDFISIFDTSKWIFGMYNDKIDIFKALVNKRVILYSEIGNRQPYIPYKEDVFLSPILRDRKALGLIKEGIYNYLKSIDKPVPESVTVAFHLLLAMSKSAKAGDIINIFSFNYTRVLMRGYEMKGIPVHYMHGSCENNNIIVGTRDDLRMETEYDFLMKSMDDSFNPPDIISALKDADEVIIFGHSLGENDRQYFVPFFLGQVDYNNPKRKDITIFTRDDNSKVEIKRALQKMTNGKLSALYSINQPTIIRATNLKEDQESMLDFLLKHHTDKHYASEVIGKLLQQPCKTNQSVTNEYKASWTKS